jgi:hypothetical protein
MMKSIHNMIYVLAVIVVGVAGVSSASQAATISYQGTVIPSFSSGIGSGSTAGQNWVDEPGASGFWSTVTGSVGGSGWIDGNAKETAFWSFSVGPGGTSLDIWALRGDEKLDTAFSVYSGITTADEAKFSVDGFDDIGVDFGGITFLGFADDELPNQGEFGDPAIYNMAFDEGIYTIAIGGYVSDGEGPFPYELSIGTPGSAPNSVSLEPVPLPSTFFLFATGLLGFVSVRKYKY